MTHGTLKVTATINASASAFDIAADKITPILASAATAPTVVSKTVPFPVNNALITPSTASLETMDATNAMNVCQLKPKNLVTGSIKVPNLYNTLSEATPLDE